MQRLAVATISFLLSIAPGLAETFRENKHECESLGFKWGQVCEGNGNYGYWVSGCIVGPHAHSQCPISWTFSAKDASESGDLVCGSEALEKIDEPSGC